MERLTQSAKIALLVFAACQFAFQLRSTGFLAELWPANALLLAYFVRNRQSLTWPAWIVAAVAYIASDLITGNTLTPTLLLTAGNLSGVATGYYCYARLKESHVRLEEPTSVSYLVLISFVSAGIAGCVGAIAGPILLSSTALQGWLFWFSAELVNYLVILPLALTLSVDVKTIKELKFLSTPVRAIGKAMPFICFLLTLSVALYAGEIKILALTIPTLLWCAVTYDLFAVALLTLLTSAIALIKIGPSAHVGALAIHEQLENIPFRLSIALLALAPIALASVMAARARLLRELQEKNEALKRADQAKDRFLAVMSHELRTPLTGILGIADLMLTGSLSPEQQNFLKTLVRSGQSLLGLVNDILDFSKIAAGRLELEQQPFLIDDVLRDVCSLFTGAASKKGLSIVLKLPESYHNAVLGDELRIRQVLSNLISNAIKFTDHGQITVQVSQERLGAETLKLHIAVVDTGIGIAPEKIDYLFQPFAQADKSITRRYGGTGLGLAISRNLVLAMGGQIFVSSREGGGTTISFYILLTPLSDSAATPAAHRDVSRAMRSGDVAKSAALNILLAEDDAALSALIFEMLKREGHVVTAVSDGAAAVKLAHAQAFDVILMDMHMPIYDGPEAMRLIRDQERSTGRRIPIIALTADITPSGRKAYAVAGADAVHGKPIQWDDLLDDIKRLAV
ncbi:MAG: response regulator [Rhodospirillaceae bacterium]|nr:response regulator [Rhodospirillaceae bacterium]